MCGLIATKGKYDETKISRRGDTLRNEIQKNGYTFIHHLLNVTGEVTPQPFVEEGIVCLYNGEIYNHKYEGSDGETLIPLYKRYGEKFTRYLDGEFAIALYDFHNDIVIFATDAFGTKPIWVNVKEAASYFSGVGGNKLTPNTTRVVSLKTGKHEEFSTHTFDFDNQHKDTYIDWAKAFDKAVRKRATENCFIGLSSGYDSGGIACSLNRLHIDYTAYSIIGSEDKHIVEARHEYIRNGEILQISRKVFDEERQFLKENTEPYTYSYKSHENSQMLDDNATVGLGIICREAKSRGSKVYLSGQGADEILSDYSKFPSQSELMGRYPERLKVWRNFYGGCQESYLMKEEIIAGTYAIETRYPFLDKEVVQEFLWLSTAMKNAKYKAPLDAYLEYHRFPFSRGKKVGFNPQVGI